MLHKATQSIRKQISSMTPKIWKYWSLFSRQFLWLERWRLLDPEQVNINLKRLSSFTPLHRISLSVNVHKHVVRAMSILTSLRSNWKIFLENSAWPKNCPATAFTRTEQRWLHRAVHAAPILGTRPSGRFQRKPHFQGKHIRVNLTEIEMIEG